MPFRLSLWHRQEELCAREDPTDDPVVAIYNCRLFAAEVTPVLRTLPQYRKLTEGELEKHTDRMTFQVSLFPNGNGKHV